MPLYGHELSETINPFEAGLGFSCHLVGYDFPGRDALLRIEKSSLCRVRVGLGVAGQRVPRQGYAIHCDGYQVGEVTSGTFSPTLKRPIAMGFVKPAAAVPGTELQIDIRGRAEPARVVEIPFYERGRKRRELKTETSTLQTTRRQPHVARSEDAAIYRYARVGPF